MAANSLAFFVILILSLPFFATSSHQTIFNVLDYGAVGNGEIDDTNAFARTWEKTCASSSNSPTMQIPSYKTFFVKPIEFLGPCKSFNVTVLMDGNMVAPSDPSSWECEKNYCDKWISFKRVNGLNLYGTGRFDGRGTKWWDGKHEIRPNTVEISSSRNVHVGNGLRFKDSPRVHLVLNSLKSVYVSDITIQAPENSPNTDGIRVASSIDVHIDHSRIGTGDDCIAMIGGSSYVTISDIVCGPGHGISVGSLGRDGAYDYVEHVTVSDVVFTGATNGARIKTWQGGKGYAKNIVFERILVHDTSNPIIIDKFYCDHQHCMTRESAVQISNVTYSQIVGTSMRKKIEVKLVCSEVAPCKDIKFENVHIVGRDGSDAKYECSNVFGRTVGDKVPRLSCLD